jgi:glycosyltransferase involved in cell wall biosynthesis
MQSAAMVSVVIPTYNRGRMLRDALTSVLAQNPRPREIIVVDDGSEDDTGAVIGSFGAALRHVRQAHRGVSAARNAGVRLAAGPWIAFLDSDDLWLPGKLAAQIEYLRHHSHLKICQTQELWLRNGCRLNPREYHRKPQGHCFALLLERCLVSPSAVIVRKDLLLEVGLFDSDLPACEDYDLWLRIGCRHPIGLVDRPLIVKRGGHEDQLSATVPALDRYRIAAIEKLLRQGCLSDVQRGQALRVLARKCRVYGSGCWKRGRFDEARAMLSLPLQLGGLPDPVRDGVGGGSGMSATRNPGVTGSLPSIGMT